MELLRGELKQLRRINKKIKYTTLNLDKYEDVYSNEWEELKDDIDLKLYKEKRESRRFWYSISIGIILSTLGILISYI